MNSKFARYLIISLALQFVASAAFAVAPGTWPQKGEATAEPYRMGNFTTLMIEGDAAEALYHTLAANLSVKVQNGMSYLYGKDLGCIYTEATKAYRCTMIVMGDGAIQSNFVDIRPLSDSTQ